jgi:hypothetical protein
MVKQVATLILIVIGSIWLGPWTKEMTAISEAAQSQVLQNSQYSALQENVAIGGALQTVALLSIIIISTVKPWSRRNTARKAN